MANVHTLNELNGGVDLVSGNKLGNLPSNRYPPSRTELENQLASANQERDIAISCGIQIGNKCKLLIKNNESFSVRICQLENEVTTKLEEIQAFQSKIDKLEQDASLSQKELSEMNSLKRKLELDNVELTNENISLNLVKKNLEDSLTKKKMNWHG